MTVDKYSLAYFQAMGKKHGGSGGRKAAAGMTPEERRERALKAVAARKWHPVLTEEEKAARQAAKRPPGRPRKVKPMTAETEQYRSALKTAQEFIEAELEQRRSSFLPTPTDDEQDYIGEAEQALAMVTAALESAGKP